MYTLLITPPFELPQTQLLISLPNQLVHYGISYRAAGDFRKVTREFSRVTRNRQFLRICLNEKILVAKILIDYYLRSCWLFNIFSKSLFFYEKRKKMLSR